MIIRTLSEEASILKMIKGMRICEKHEKLWKILKTNKNWCSLKTIAWIHDSTCHNVHNIMIYNIVSHNFLFIYCFLDITHWPIPRIRHLVKTRLYDKLFCAAWSVTVKQHGSQVTAAHHCAKTTLLGGIKYIPAFLSTKISKSNGSSASDGILDISLR